MTMTKLEQARWDELDGWVKQEIYEDWDGLMKPDLDFWDYVAQRMWRSSDDDTT